MLCAFHWLPLFANPRDFQNLKNDILTAVKIGNIERLSIASPEETNTRDLKNLNFTPLLYALKQRNRELASILMTRGARAGIESDDGETPLFLAIKAGILTESMLTKMLKTGASIEHSHKITGMTAVLYASQAGDLSALKLLSENGASLDRRNPVSLKNIIDYTKNENQEIIEFLMTSHRFFTKTVQRFGFHFIYDKYGFPTIAAINNDKVSYYVKKDLSPIQIAEFSRKSDESLEYVKNFDFTKSKLSRTWQRWFANPFHAYYYDFFDVKDFIPGKSLAYWLSDKAVINFESTHPEAEELRTKLKSFLIRMLRNGQGFVGDMRTESLIFHNARKEWVLTDGKRSVSCYATEEHVWVWTEYCSANSKIQKKTILEAFQHYAIGDPTQRDPKDKHNFGVWLNDPVVNGETLHLRNSAKTKLTELISSINLIEISN